MISVSLTVDTIFENKETYDFNRGIKMISPKTSFYIGNMSIESRTSFFFVNPYQTSLNMDIRKEHISIDDRRWIPYVFEDKNEFFQYQLIHDYGDLTFEHLVKLKELFDLICTKINYEIQ